LCKSIVSLDCVLYKTLAFVGTKHGDLHVTG
jgi:hypothetical protein